LESKKELKLSSLKTKDFIPELGFYYQNKAVKSQKLISIIRGDRQQHPEKGEAGAGFLKGFIDLIFQFDDKFYLLDYKTNFLGDSYEDYEFEKLQDEMSEASYDLQYHIYTIALHRFLNKKLPEYSYEKHFGGVFYLFLRGIHEGGRQGIFFDRPSRDTIRKLNRYIREGEG